MTTVAQLKIDAGFNQSAALFTFLAWKTETDWSPDTPVSQLEEIRATGVSGLRYRETGKVSPLIVVESMTWETTYATAVAKAREYAARVGRVAELTLFGRNVANAKYNVTIVDCIPRPRSGTVSGQTGTGIIQATWTLRRLA
jgi:hypothetical protein